MSSNFLFVLSKQTAAERQIGVVVVAVVMGKGKITGAVCVCDRCCCCLEWNGTPLF